MDITGNLSKIIYLGLNIILLGILFIYSLERVGRKKAFLVLLLAAVFPFNISYNDVYYTSKFTGILFILLIPLSYYLFFRILRISKYNWQHIIFFAIISLIIRLRVYFLIIILLLIITIFIKWVREGRTRYIFYSFPITIIGTGILFYLQPISLFHYLQLDKFGIPNFKLLIDNFFIFPRENAIIFILILWLIFFNILALQSKKETEKKKEILHILIPEIVIVFIYLVFFSNNDVLSVGLFIGVLPFIPLNIYYFFEYINGFSIRSRNIIIIIYILFCLVFLFFINKTLINLLSSIVF